MYRASDILQNTRIEKDLSIEEISKKTKIPIKYLNAFEKEDKNNFPQEPYCSLILKDYANFLGLNGERILMIFRRDFEIKNKITPKTKKTFYFSPQLSFSLSLFFVFALFLGYLLNEYFKFNRPPKLKVDWPHEFTNPLFITGLTDPNNTIKINEDLIIIEKDGKFEYSLKINKNDDEEKKILIEARSPAGKISKDEKIY